MKENKVIAKIAQYRAIGRHHYLSKEPMTEEQKEYFHRKPYGPMKANKSKGVEA